MAFEQKRALAHAIPCTHAYFSVVSYYAYLYLLYPIECLQIKKYVKDSKFVLLLERDDRIKAAEAMLQHDFPNSDHIAYSKNVNRSILFKYKIRCNWLYFIDLPPCWKALRYSDAG